MEHDPSSVLTANVSEEAGPQMKSKVSQKNKLVRNKINENTESKVTYMHVYSCTVAF